MSISSVKCLKRQENDFFCTNLVNLCIIHQKNIR